jgi:hypothetical protein
MIMARFVFHHDVAFTGFDRGITVTKPFQITVG